MTAMNAEIKAALLAVGSVDLDPSLLPGRSSSTAGPGTGLQSIFFRSGGRRVRLEVDTASPLKMVRTGDGFAIVRDGRELVRGDLEPVIAHCPGQAYITISERCVCDCTFCAVPKLQGKIKTVDEIIAIVEKARNAGELMVISLTSGIATSPEDEIDRVVGLEIGADDYIVKPFSMRELLVRVKARLKTYHQLHDLKNREGVGTQGEQLNFDNLTIDLVRHEVTLDGTPLQLKPKEFELLAYLVENRGRALTRELILDKVWGWDFVGDSRTVDVHIRWLRSKIEENPDEPVRIVTVRGAGYRFEG